jgi:type IV secretory pathway protease TraF
MPWWHGCVTLAPGRYLLLMDADGSFDGRYFGPVARCQIVGRATPLWTWR